MKEQDKNNNNKNEFDIYYDNNINQLLARKSTAFLNQKKILSALFKDYQNLDQDNYIKKKSIEFIIPDTRHKRNTINDLQINYEDEFSKVIISKLDNVKNKYLSRFNNCIEKFKMSFDEYKDNINKYIIQNENNLSRVFNENINLK